MENTNLVNTVYDEFTPSRPFGWKFEKAVNKYIDTKIKSGFNTFTGDEFKLGEFISIGYNVKAEDMVDAIKLDAIFDDIMKNSEINKYSLTVLESVAIVLSNLKNHYPGHYETESDTVFHNIVPVHEVYRGMARLQSFFNQKGMPYLIPDCNYSQFLKLIIKYGYNYNVVINDISDNILVGSESIYGNIPRMFGWKGPKKEQSGNVAVLGYQPFFAYKEVQGIPYIVVEDDTIFEKRIYGQLDDFAELAFVELNDYLIFKHDCKALVDDNSIFTYNKLSKIQSSGKFTQNSMLVRRIASDAKAKFQDIEDLLGYNRQYIFMPAIRFRIMSLINLHAGRNEIDFRFTDFNKKSELPKTLWEDVEEFQNKLNQNKLKENKKIKKKGKEVKVSQLKEEFKIEDYKDASKEFLGQTLEDLALSLHTISGTISSLKGSIDKLEGTLESVKSRYEALEVEFKNKFGENIELDEEKLLEE